MHTPNFAAQVERALTPLADGGNPGYHIARAILDAIPRAQHFTVPEGGRLFDDELRGLDTDLRGLRLPFPTITVSFASEGRRTLVVAQEQGKDEHRALVIMVAVDTDDGQGWGFFPCTAQPQRHHEDGSIVWQCFDTIGGRLDRTPMHEAVMFAGRSVLELLEGLSCTNVTSEVVQRIDKAVNARRRRQGKLPMYEVRRLVVKVGEVVHTIGRPMGERSDVREHLRRGHVRRLSDGRKTWVQACVVGSRARGVVERSSYVVELA